MPDYEKYQFTLIQFPIWDENVSSCGAIKITYFMRNSIYKYSSVMQPIKISSEVLMIFFYHLIIMFVVIPIAKITA